MEMGEKKGYFFKSVANGIVSHLHTSLSLPDNWIKSSFLS